MKFEWTKDLITGSDTIDEQHMLLFIKANKFSESLDSGDKSKVEDLFNFLIDYVKEHFGNEESIMQENNYPDFYIHKQAHEMLLYKLTTAYDSLINGEYDKNKHEEANELLIDWYRSHILSFDRNLATFLKEVR